MLTSLRSGAGEREFLTYMRGLGMGFKVESTGHRFIYVLRHDDPRNVLAFLTSLRLGIIPINGISLARPFNKRYNLGESKTYKGIAYEVGSALEDAVPGLLKPVPRSLRLKVRGHGIGVGNAIREDALAILTRLGVSIRRRSWLVLDIEVLRTSSGGVRLYIGYFPVYLYVRYASVRRLSQAKDALIPRAISYNTY